MLGGHVCGPANIDEGSRGARFRLKLLETEYSSLGSLG
jgi:hypothetical protein